MNELSRREFTNLDARSVGENVAIVAGNNGDELARGERTFHDR